MNSVILLSKSIKKLSKCCTFSMHNICLNCYARFLSSTSVRCEKKLRKYSGNEDPSVIKTEESCDSDVLHDEGTSDVSVAEPIFPELIHKVHHEVGFWQTEQGLKLYDSLWTGSGRLLRMFVPIERYDNWWEHTMNVRVSMLESQNKFDEILLRKEGPEWALCYIVLKLGGAVKLVTDDRWVDDPGNLRTPSKKDCTIEAVDLRKSVLNYEGMKYFDDAGYVKYLTVADSPTFDNYCMTCLHPIAHTLEYLDISGTSVTPDAFSYFRIFANLRWLNISRLSNQELVKSLIPFLQEILPRDCVIVCDDYLPAESYGCLLPHRNAKDPTKDALIESGLHIGNVDSFLDEYKFNALEVNDVTAIHKLWQTPIISKQRQGLLELLKLKDKSITMTAVEYIKKAEQFKPLF